MASRALREECFPAPSRVASAVVNGIRTEASSLGFSDTMLVTISQRGRLSQWFQVILTGSPGSIVDLSLPNLGHNLLPTTHLTPKTLFGAADGDREVFGQLCAAQIASYLMILRPEDKRTLVLGLGLSGRQSDREAFFDLFDLVQRVL